MIRRYQRWLTLTLDLFDTIEQDQADSYELTRWYRFLFRPPRCIGTPNWYTRFLICK
jgi:hypothetical protein